MTAAVAPAARRAPLRDGAALAFALLFPLCMAWVYLVLMAAGGRSANPLFMAGYCGGKVVQFVFPALYVFCFEREQLQPARPAARGVLLGVGFAAAVAALIFGLYFTRLAGDPDIAAAAGRIHGKLAEFGLDSPGGFVLAAVFLSAAHSLFEEYYWRWFAFGWLKRYLPVWGAAALSGLGFMAHHVVILAVFFPGRFWTMAAPYSLGIAAGGVVWAWIYHRSGSLLGPWLSHALIDAAILAVGYDMLRAGWAG